MFPHNMSALDRRIRAGVGAGLVLSAVARRGPLGIVGGLVGAVLLFTVATPYMLPFGLFQLLYGPLADRYGKLRVVVWSLVLFTAGTTITATGAGLTELTAYRDRVAPPSTWGCHGVT